MWEPFISILVPVRNEERYIERCLYSIARQDYPRSRFEVLVIDGQSTDRTKLIVSRFAAESTVDLRLLQNARYRTAAGMNIGLAEARGEVIVRVDGHASIEPDFLSRSVEALYETRADCVGGVIESEGDTYMGRAIALAMSSRFGVGGASFRTGGEGPVDTVAFGAYRREVFDRIGGFAEDIDKGEDDELNYRLRDHGGTIVLVPGIRARYTVRGDLRSAWRQYIGYGQAKPEVLRRHPAQAQARQLVPGGVRRRARRVDICCDTRSPRAAQGAAGGVYWRCHHRISRSCAATRLATRTTSTRRLLVFAPRLRVWVHRRLRRAVRPNPHSERARSRPTQPGHDQQVARGERRSRQASPPDSVCARRLLHHRSIAQPLASRRRSKRVASRARKGRRPGHPAAPFL